jgi:ubiquinone/menaquinone biosynthesis C-methylase UbiE
MKTSWDNISDWYSGIVGKEGHYFHQQVIFPALLPLIGKKGKLLDLGCGSGVLERALPAGLEYVGIDLSPSLLKVAEEQMKGKKSRFLPGDITKRLPIEENDFTHATIILALQNLEHPNKALENAFSALKKGGTIFLVFNHPCFRIPRQSSWGVEKEKGIQYRRIDRYMSTMTIPIQQAPSKGEKSATSLSFHYPLSAIASFVTSAGFSITGIDELISNKKSTGGAAKMENRAREEFPMFMLLSAKKI